MLFRLLTGLLIQISLLVKQLESVLQWELLRQLLRARVNQALPRPLFLLATVSKVHMLTEFGRRRPLNLTAGQAKEANLFVRLKVTQRGRSWKNAAFLVFNTRMEYRIFHRSLNQQLSWVT